MVTPQWGWQVNVTCFSPSINFERGETHGAGRKSSILIWDFVCSSTNFSKSGIIRWFRTSFAGVLPAKETGWKLMPLMVSILIHGKINYVSHLIWIYPLYNGWNQDNTKICSPTISYRLQFCRKEVSTSRFNVWLLSYTVKLKVDVLSSASFNTLHHLKTFFVVHLITII